MFYIEIIDNKITRYTENEKVANKFYENITKSKNEPVRSFDGKLYLSSNEIPKEAITLEEQQKIKSQILELESKKTIRRMTEALLGNEESIAFIKDIEAQI